MSAEGIEKLVAWAKKEGAHVNDAIEFKYVEEKGISAFAGAKIDPSQPNISIPIAITLNPGQAKEFFGVDFLQAKDINSVTKHYLNYQRSLGKDSFWHSYIDVLPDGATINTPLYWASGEQEYLKGTNIGSSLAETLEVIIEEWYDSLQFIPDRFKNGHVEPAEVFYQDFKAGKLDLAELGSRSVAYDSSNWLSFPAYLWATAVFKSRSFPYLLVDEDADPKYSMLLPVVDLLNHNPDAFVSWSVDDTKSNFIFNNNMSSVLAEGDEIFNNYGGKGNEELLLGYGFVLEDNKTDSVALRIKVPVETLPAVERLGVRLPTLEDYTTSVYSLKPAKKVTNYNEYSKGLLYYCNRDTILPANLVDLFAFLVKNEIEQMMSLRMRLDGLTHLRNALEAKLKVLKNSPAITDNTTRAQISSIYKKGQQSLLTKMVSEAKDQEKRILKDQKSKIWDLAKILKKDQLFANSLLLTFGLRDAEDIQEAGVEDHILILWLIRCYNRQDQDFLPSWIHEIFQNFVEKVPVSAGDEAQFKELHSYFFPALIAKIPEIYGQGHWSLKEMVISGKLLQLISYTRGAKQNLILVEPVAISVAN